jgi:molybdopterin/thiamine biosynthesis adenylyltransferase
MRGPRLDVKVVGVGGIGGALVPFLARLLDTHEPPARLTLIDGDEFEARNRLRQAVPAYGNKATILAAELARTFDRLSVRAIPEYIGEDNVAALIEEGDYVLLTVDNHPSRRVVSDHCSRLGDVVVISGGNELYDGNVQVFVRRGGEERCPSLTQYHPEIARAVGPFPGEGCDMQVASAPQLLVTNLAVASAMLNALYACLWGTLTYEEVYLDIMAGRMNPVARKGMRQWPRSE